MALKKELKMKAVLFTVYDSKAEAWKNPFITESRAHALRSWETAINDDKTDLSRWPGDFTLFEIGKMDLLSGEVEIYESKISLGTGLEYKKSPKADNAQMELLKGKK